MTKFAFFEKVDGETKQMVEIETLPFQWRGDPVVMRKIIDGMAQNGLYLDHPDDCELLPQIFNKGLVCIKNPILVIKANWDESKHPREHGKFTSKGGGQTVDGQGKPIAGRDEDIEMRHSVTKNPENEGGGITHSYRGWRSDGMPAGEHHNKTAAENDGRQVNIHTIRNGERMASHYHTIKGDGTEAHEVMYHGPEGDAHEEAKDAESAMNRVEELTGRKFISRGHPGDNGEPAGSPPEGGKPVGGKPAPEPNWHGPSAAPR
jgi:hypothetical protein